MNAPRSATGAAANWLGIALCLFGCASTGGFDDPEAASDGAAGDSANFFNPDSGADSVLMRFGFDRGDDIADPFAPTGVPSCAAGNVIYLLTGEGILASFEPITSNFEMIGKVVCPGESDSPNSMTIDRAGTAWVNFHSGAIYHVSTTDASCTATSYPTAQRGWRALSLAFVADPVSQADVLYVTDNTSVLRSLGDHRNEGLGRIDLATMTLSIIGSYGPPITERPCELTGLADGTLHALCPGTRTVMAELDTSDAGIVAHVELPIGEVEAFAYAQWGGDYYIFSTPRFEVGSRVDRFVPGYGTKRIVQDAGFRIVGAGVSTCAPLSVD